MGVGMGARTGAGTGTGTIIEIKVEDTESLETYEVPIGGSEDARRWATQTNNQQPQPQDPTPQRDHRIMLRTRAQGREEGGGETKKRKKPHKSCRRDFGHRGDLGGKIQKLMVDKKVLVQ